MINLSKEPTESDKSVDRKSTEAETENLTEDLASLQTLLFAEKKHSLLIVLQGMDAAGKDGTIKHVFSSMNPMGVNVKAFKEPTPEEKEHDFLWRVHPHAPAKGMIEIFNRSHYEDILVPFVSKSIPEELIKERCEEINMFERGLVKDNTIVFKFYLHVSHKEQLIRIEARKTDEHKRWKYQKADVIAVRKHDEYREAYEFVFENCNKDVLWQIVPADKKWYKNFYILRAIVNELQKYDIHYPRTEL